MLLPQQAFTQSKPVSAATRQKILTTYQFLKDSLLTLPKEPFLIRNEGYSEEGFESVRLQIAKGNLSPVRAYVLKALNSEDVTNQVNLYVAAKSLWVDYLLSVDSTEQAYQAAVSLLRFADSLKTSNRSLAYVAVGKSGSTLEEHYSHSAENAAKALSNALQKGDKALEAKARLIIGVLARGLFWGTSGRSIPHYDKAIDAAISGKDTATLIRTLYLKHADIAQPGDVNRGFPSLEQAIHLTAQSRYLRYIPNMCLGIMIDLEAIGEKDKGTEMLLAALDRTKQWKARQTELHLYIQLSGLYTSRHLYDSALYYLEQWKIPDPLDPGRKPLMLIKANVYYQMGRYKEAAMLYQENNREQEKAYALHGQNVLSRWETTLRMQDKELVIQENTAKRKQLIWIISGIILILAVCLSALLWQRSLRRRLAAQNRLISRQSQKLEQSLAEKDILLKEIHHRVKNNLQVIDSLLDMHQGGNELPASQQESFMKARTHVHTISMIHQHLYQRDKLSAVNMHSFVSELFTQTAKMFNKTGGAIVFDNRVPEAVNLDIDTAVPLGLILNELLTNAFKYVLPIVDEMHLSLNIAAADKPKHFVMQYEDNGPGVPPDFDVKQGGSMGMQLIQQLSRQMGGKAGYLFDNGSHFTISFLTLEGRKQID